MAEGGALYRESFAAPPRAAEAQAVAKRSAPLAFVMGVVWVTVVLSGVIGWAFGFPAGANSYYLFMLVFLPYFVALRLREVAALAARPQFWLWALTALLPIVLFFFGSTDPWAVASLKNRIITFSFVAGSALVLTAPDARRILRVSALIVLAFAIPLFFIELVAGSIFSVTEGRAAGFYGNANDAGAAILLCFLLAVDLRRPTSRGLFLAAICIAAVFATFSRSAILFGAAVFSGYALAPRAGTGEQGAQRVVVLALIAVAAAVAVVFLSRNIDLSDEAAMRLHSVLTANISDASAQGRFQKAEYALRLVRESMWGHGMGFVERRDVEPHNTYLYLAIDYGVLGLGLYLTILLTALGSSLRAGWRSGANAIAIALLLIWSSFFTHYVANASFFAIGFASFISGTLLSPRAERARTRDVAAIEGSFERR